MAKKILIVDDNEQDWMIIKRYLGKAGYEKIVIAQTGEDGVKQAEAERPTLIILDTMLPGIDGFEVCRKIRKLKFTSAPKIVMVTGAIDAVDAVKARKAGADDYCAKTSDAAPILTAVKNLL